jgi:hypothetical protein
MLLLLLLLSPPLFMKGRKRKKRKRVECLGFAEQRRCQIRERVRTGA